MTEDPRQLLNRALHHHNHGQLDLAEQLYSEVLKSNPGHADALHLHGVIAHQRGIHELAIEQIQKAVALQPQNAAFLNNLGEAYRAQHLYARAVDCYRKALSVSAQDLNALNNLGIALHHMQRFQESEQAFLRALQQNPADPEVHMNLGNMLRDQGQLDKAITCYRSAIRQAPNFAPAHGWLGVTLYEAGQEQPAVNALCEAARLDPLNIEIHNNLKRLRWNMDDAALMHDSFRSACEQCPEVPDTYLNYAESLLLSYQFDEAEPVIRQALRLAPRDPRSHSLLGRMYLGRDQLQAALNAHQQSLDLGNDPLLAEEASNALLLAGRFDQAREILQHGHGLVPRRSSLLARLAIAMRELADPILPQWVDYQQYVFTDFIDVPEGFADLESFNAALHEELKVQHTTPNHALEQSMRGGTQTLNNLFQNPTGLVAVLKRQISKVVDRYIAGLDDDPTHPFLRYKNPDYVFTGTWSTILHSAGFDNSHIHNEGWLSGTYYVRVPDLDAQQQRDEEGHIQFGEPPKCFISDHSHQQRAIAPQVGRMALFPSYYWHGVKPFYHHGIRHSVSYDII